MKAIATNQWLIVKLLGVAVLLIFCIGRAEGEDATKHSDCCSSANPGQAVLSADQFFGQSALSYTAAKQIPEICCKLFCYCGCDQVDGHTTLLECFTSDHSANCDVCQKEVLQALRLKKEGKSLAQIQQWIDEHFEKEYIFDKPSKTLQEYRLKRLWKKRPS